MGVQENFEKIMASGGDFFQKRFPLQVRAIRETKAPLPKKFIALLKVVDEISEHVGPHTPCKEGCHHCCHMAVTITGYEAEKIGRHIGINPLRPPMVTSRSAEVKEWMGVTCPFLENSNCTIYDVRPIACRGYFNISDDPSLCDLTKGAQDVPGINLQELWLLQAEILWSTGMGDIRDFFPDGMKTVQSRS